MSDFETFLKSIKKVNLSDLEPVESSNICSGLHFDSIHCEPYNIFLSNRKYDKGLGMHPPDKGIGKASWKLNGKYTWFESKIGIAKPVKQTDGVIFSVWVDGIRNKKIIF